MHSECALGQAHGLNECMACCKEAELGTFAWLEREPAWPCMAGTSCRADGAATLPASHAGTLLENPMQYKV